MVEVFKTNVSEPETSKILIRKLLFHFPDHIISFDLSDCDKILRIEGDSISQKLVTDVLLGEGFYCEVLD